MSKLSRYRDLVILVAVASLLAWFLRAGSVDGEAHVAVVTAFHGLGAQEARRDHELLALRYGLSMNYDGLRAIERQLVRLRRALDDAPHLVEAVPDRDVKRTLSELDVGLTEKARRVDDFVSGSAMLNNALRGLPKVAAMVVGPAPAPSDGAIRTELERLVGAVFRYSLTGEQQIRDEAVRLIASVGEFATEPGSERRDKLQTTLFLARSIVGGQEAVDRELREILVLDGNSRIDRAREAYIGAHSILEQRVRSSRWWLYGCCLGLLAYALFKHMQFAG